MSWDSNLAVRLVGSNDEYREVRHKGDLVAVVECENDYRAVVYAGPPTSECRLRSFESENGDAFRRAMAFAKGMAASRELGMESDAPLDGTTRFNVPTYYECGICENWHPADWNGDCRDDAHRFDPDELDARHGPNGWQAIDMDSVDDVVEMYEDGEGDDGAAADDSGGSLYRVTLTRVVRVEQVATVYVRGIGFDEAAQRALSRARQRAVEWGTRTEANINDYGPAVEGVDYESP